MTNDIIEKFIEGKNQQNRKINIHFKQRPTLTGMFIKTNDFEELKAKNFLEVCDGAKIGRMGKH